MSTAGVEIGEWLNRDTIERVYGRAMRFQEEGRMGYAETGLRAARARDPKLLKCLEKGAEILTQMSVEQLGHHYSHAGKRMDATEAQLWRAAFNAADNGDPAIQYRWIFGAAAELAGYNG